MNDECTHDERYAAHRRCATCDLPTIEQIEAGRVDVGTDESDGSKSAFFRQAAASPVDRDVHRDAAGRAIRLNRSFQLQSSAFHLGAEEMKPNGTDTYNASLLQGLAQCRGQVARSRKCHALEVGHSSPCTRGICGMALFAVRL